MVEQFNRILQAFGSNRVRLVKAGASVIELEIVGWSRFCIFESGGSIAEVSGDGLSLSQHTARARWLKGLSQGKQRNDAGEAV